MAVPPRCADLSPVVWISRYQYMPPHLPDCAMTVKTLSGYFPGYLMNST